MNSLSWLIYASQVVAGFRLLISVIAGIFTAFLVGSFISVPASEGETYDWVRRNIRWMVITPIAAWLLFIFVPSENTIFAVAASQVGERVVQDETVKGIANDATKALQQWIKRQIEPPSITEKH